MFADKRMLKKQIVRTKAGRFSRGPMFHELSRLIKRFQRSLADPNHKRQVERYSAERALRRQAEWRNRLQSAGIKPILLGAYDTTYWPAGWTAGQQFYRAFRSGGNKNLILCGRSGVGKSHLAATLAVQAVKDGRSVFWLNAELYKTLLFDGIADPSSRAEAARMYRRALEVDLLVIDDVAKRDTKWHDGKTTSWDAHKLYLIMELRGHRSTIITCEWDLRDPVVIARLTESTVNRMEDSSIKAICPYQVPYRTTVTAKGVSHA